jgi:D-arabinose 1-dehydrogenase-like Zn-dependent alcohol dehydrogenase
MQTRLKSFVLSPFVSQKLVTALARPNKDDLITMRELMATGKVKPVINKCYSLSQVPEAIRYLAKGHAQGKVVITLGHNNKT